MEPSTRHWPRDLSFYFTRLVIGLVLSVVICSNANAQAPGSATLSWTAPTENTDGSPLTDLAGYVLYYGMTDGGPYTTQIQIDDPAATTFVVDNLAPGTYYFVSTAVNAASVESDLSNQAMKVIQAAPVIPNPPGQLMVLDPDLTVFTIVKQQDRFLLLPVGTVPAGTACDPDQSVNGHFAVPRAEVLWSGTVQPLVVVARCA